MERGGGGGLERTGMEKTEGNSFSKSKLYIEGGIEVVRNNCELCRVCVLASTRVELVRLCIKRASHPCDSTEALWELDVI